MNRRDRRAARAQQKKSPSSELPPGYVELVKRMCELIMKWVATEPGLPDLRWHDPGDVMYVATLESAVRGYLAASPDAHRLLEWLDAQTDHKGSLFQATMALRFLGYLPGGPEPDVKHESAALQQLKNMAFRTGTETEPSPCGHCGKVLDRASAAKDRVPKPGDWSICFNCFGLNVFDDALQLRAATQAEIDAMDPAFRGHVEESQALLRQTRMGKMIGGPAKAEA